MSFISKKKNTGLLYFKDLELHTIELNKFTQDSNEKLTDIIAKIKNSLDMWIAFLTRNDLLNIDNLPKELNDKSIKKALEVLQVMNFSPEEREFYEDHLKWLRIETNTLKKTREKSLAEGEAKGRKEGREEGIAIGETRGIEKVAISMLKLDLPLDSIIKATGLSKQQIDKLKLI